MRTYHCPKGQFAFWYKSAMQNLGADWSWTWRSLFSTTFSVSLPSSFHQHLPTALLSISLLCLSSSMSALLLVQLPSCLFHLSIFTFSSFPLPCLHDPQPSMLVLSMEANFTHYQVTGKKKNSVSKRYIRHRGSRAGDSLCDVLLQGLFCSCYDTLFPSLLQPPPGHTSIHTSPPSSLSDDREMLSGTDYQSLN